MGTCALKRPTQEEQSPNSLEIEDSFVPKVTTPSEPEQLQTTALGGEIVTKYTSRPFETSEHAHTQERGSGKHHMNLSRWLRCSHSVHSHCLQLNDHTLVAFASDGDAQIFYTYDSNRDTFSKFHAASMRPRERYVAAAAYKVLNTIYAVTTVAKGEESQKQLRLLCLDLNTKRWAQVATLSTSERMLGAVMAGHELLLVGHAHCWLYAVTSSQVRLKRAWDMKNLDVDLSWLNSRDVEVNLFFMPNTGRVLMVAHGQTMFTLDVDSSEAEPAVAVPLRLQGKQAFSQLERFGCLLTRGGAHVLLFTESGAIWVVDTRSWNGRQSAVKCPAESQGRNGLFTWMMTNTDNRAVDGFVRQSYAEHGAAGAEMRFLSQDALGIIKSFYGTWFVHLFMRGNGFHWAMGLKPILDGNVWEPNRI